MLANALSASVHLRARPSFLSSALPTIRSHRNRVGQMRRSATGGSEGGGRLLPTYSLSSAGLSCCGRRGARLGQVYEAAQKAQHVTLGNVGEEVHVDLLDDGNRALGQPGSSPGHTQPARAGVGRVDLALEQTF